MKLILRSLFMVALLTGVVLITSAGVLAQGPVTIEWWTVASEDFDEASQRAMVDAFNASHTDVQVNMTLLPSEGYDERMQTALGSNEGAPDVALFWNTDWYPQALDLTEFVKNDPKVNQSIYYENFWATRSVWKDEIVGLPLGVGANFVMYNKDLFDAAKVAYPDPNWTTDDYNKIVSQLAIVDKHQWGGDRPRGPYRAIFYNYGANLYSDDSKTVDGYLSSPASVAAYSWLANLVGIEGGTPTPADLDVLGTAGTGPVDLFMADRIAMATLNQGHLQNVIAAGKNFGVVPEPQAPGQTGDRFVNAWSLTVSIWKGTQHPKEAWEWLSYWAGPEGQTTLMEKSNLIPSIPSALANWKYADTEYGKQFMDILKLHQVAEWDNLHPCKGTVLRAVQDAWDKINLSQVTPDGVKAELDSLVQPAQAALDECVARLGG